MVYRSASGKLAVDTLVLLVCGQSLREGTFFIEGGEGAGVF